MTEVAKEVLASLSTPDQVDSRLGPLEFTDGAPARKSVETLYDHLDFVHGVNAFLTAFPAASTQAIRQGFHGIGVQDNSVLIFSELMDSSSLFLTANCRHRLLHRLRRPVRRTDGGRDAADGPGHVRRHVVPVDHRLRVARARTAARAGSSCSCPPATTASLPGGRLLRRALPHEPGADAGPVVHGGQRSRADGGDHQVHPQDLPVHARRARHQRRHAPRRDACRSRAPAEVPATTFVEGTGTAFNTIPPTDAGFFETVHALLQDEPAEAGDPEIVGHLAELGIVKGKPFAPDDRMRRILDEAATVGNATSRALMFDSRGEEDVDYYPDSAWTNMLFNGGYLFDTPVPLVTPEGIKPFPPTGARKHDLRTLFFYGYTGITPAMAMRLTGIGSQYLVAFMDSNKDVLRRSHVVHGDAAARHPPGPVLVAHAVRQPDPLAARDAAAVPPRREPVATPPRLRLRTRTARPPSTSAPSSPPASPTATGSRRCQARDGSSSSGSTARWRRSSTSPGTSARSNPRLISTAGARMPGRVDVKVEC